MGIKTKIGEVPESFAQTVAKGIGLSIYKANLEATAQLIELIFKLKGKEKLKSSQDYIESYINDFCTFKTWEDLLRHELSTEQDRTMIEAECNSLLGKTIFPLDCGYYVWDVRKESAQKLRLGSAEPRKE